MRSLFQRHPAGAGAVALAALFTLLATRMIGEPGLHADETLFGMGVFYPEGVEYKTKVLGRLVPLMQMSYLGSLKALVYKPVFAVWAPSAVSVRLPMILCGAATVALTFLLLRRLAGAVAAWVSAGLLAVDPTFLWTTRCDWGPVALQHVLTMGGVVAFVRGRFGWGGLLFGLALWHKATFLWTLFGLSAAVLASGVWRGVRLRAVVLLAVGFAAGAYPAIRYNVSTRGRTADQTARWDATDLGGKLFQLNSTLDGASLYGYTVPQRAPLPGPALPFESRFSWVAAVAGVAVLVQRNRVGLFFLLTAVVTWLAMAFTYGAGGSAHHVVLLWPWPQCVAGAAMARWNWRRAAAVVALPLLLSLTVTVQHYRVLAAVGSEPPWSDAIFALGERALREPAEGVYAIDWGILEPLRMLSAGKLRLEPAWDKPEERSVTRPGWLFIGHVDGKEGFAGVNERFRAWPGREVVAVVPDRQGRPVYEVFRYRRQ